MINWDSAEVFSWRVKSGLIRRAQGAPAIGRGKPLPKIGYANTSIPTERKFSPVLRTHAIAVFPQSHRLKPNLTRLDSAAAPRAVFLNLVTVNRFFYYSKTRFASFAVELKNKGFGNKQPNPLFFCDRRIGNANRRKGQRPFFSKTSETSVSEFLSRRVKLGFRRWLWAWDAMACVLKVRTHCGTRPKRRIKPDFTRQTGVGKIDNVNFSVGGKTPCL